MIKQLEDFLVVQLTQKNILAGMIIISIILIAIYIYFGTASHTAIEVGILGGLVSSGIINLTYFIADRSADEDSCETRREMDVSASGEGVLKTTGGGSDEHSGNISADLTGDIPAVTFKASAEVVENNPEQHLYTIMIMKLHHNAKDTRNNRELKFLAGNVTVVGASDSAYKLTIKDKNIVHGKGKKLSCKNYYIRLFRQNKPIEYSSPKDPKNYDVEQIADLHRMTSVGELTFRCEN